MAEYNSASLGRMSQLEKYKGKKFELFEPTRGAKLRAKAVFRSSNIHAEKLQKTHVFYGEVRIFNGIFGYSERPEKRS